MEHLSIELDQLILQSTRGEAGAIETILLHFHDPLLEHIRSTLCSQNIAHLDAEDLLQETLIEAFRGVRGIEARGGAAFFAWLQAIAKTRHLNRIKAQNTLKRGGDRRQIGQGSAGAGGESAAVSIFNLLIGPDHTPSSIARRKEAVAVIAAAVARLDPDRRRVIELRYGQEMSIAEVAELLGKSEGAVKMLLSRTVKELQEIVKEDFKDFSAGP